MNKMTLLTSMSHSDILWSVFFLSMGLSVATVIMVYSIIDNSVGMSGLTFRKVRDDLTIAFILYFALISVSGILE